MERKCQTSCKCGLEHNDNVAVWPTAHLHVDSVLGLLAVKHSFDIKVGAASVFLNRRTHPFSLTGDDGVWIHRCKEENCHWLSSIAGKKINILVSTKVFTSVKCLKNDCCSTFDASKINGSKVFFLNFVIAYHLNCLSVYLQQVI